MPVVALPHQQGQGHTPAVQTGYCGTYGAQRAHCKQPLLSGLLTLLMAGGARPPRLAGCALSRAGAGSAPAGTNGVTVCAAAGGSAVLGPVARGRCAPGCGQKWTGTSRLS